MLHLSAMSIDTYGLSTEQYQEFFEDNVRFAAELYLQTCNILTSRGVGSVDFKTVLDMYQEAVYQTNEDCRRYQKVNNPEVIQNRDDIFALSPSREELMAEIQAVNAKVETLVACISRLVEAANESPNGIVEPLVD